MSYSARAFRILIASPSDVVEEREIAVSVIQQWNDLNSVERQIVLLPLRWETHSAPEYGKRPQEVINKQVVDNCDLLLGIFWTRVGSPTGVAESGTIEEIERVATQGKPVMLYFSTNKKSPDEIDLEQLKRLREFKQKTFKNALVESYSSQIEFRDKFAKHIEIQIRALLASQNLPDDAASQAKAETDIHLEFADPESGARLGKEITINSTLIVIPDFDSIPDYEEKTENKSPLSGLGLMGETVNRDYYRELISYIVQRRLFQPIRFWLKNEGAIGARDIYADMTATAENGKICVLSIASLPTGDPPKFRSYYTSLKPSPQKPSDLLAGFTDTWQTQIEAPALQPKREIIPEADLVVGAAATTKITITARIFADSLPEPVTRKLTILLNVKKVELKSSDIIDAMADRGATGVQSEKE